ncbi:MAG: efflux RND transporter periplasmic adaptor subunit [Acidobacteria bacterium]|nr:efflux RND transporter periplasmic adaptor subunit [Acidobacteriota bacterium]
MRSPLFPLLAALALLAAGCNRSSRPSEASSKAPAQETLAVRVAAAETRTLARTLSATGSLLPDETVTVSSEVSGRVAEIRVDFGQSVRQGDIIAELDKREFTLQLERSRAALAQALARIGLDPGQEATEPEATPAIRVARAQMEDARFKYENAARLVKTGDVSRERFTEVEKLYQARQAACDAARDELRTALASIRALRAEVKLADKRLNDATVRAPFDGAISARLVSPGQYLRDNAPIATLVKTHPLRLRVEIPETAAAEVRVGGTLSFTTGAAPGERFHAVVSELNPSLEARSRSLVAEARLTRSQPRLRPGMFVQVELALSRAASAVVVPKAALYQVAGLNKVFVIRDGRAVEHKITPGAEIEGWVEAPGDRIRPGDQVAVSRLAALTDGAPVRLEAGR